MRDPLSSLQLLLREAKFNSKMEHVQGSTVLCFEDDALLGFAFYFATAEELLKQWKNAEMSTLMHFSSALQNAGEKAWNVYTVFLCEPASTAEERRLVQWIEEDLERTRKITAFASDSREQLIQALLPILPLQKQPLIQANDVELRLKTRIESIAPGASALILNDKVPPEDVVRFLGGNV